LCPWRRCGRLVQIRDNLLARIAEAEAYRWLGEAEGLKVSLAGSRAKLAQMNQIAAHRATAPSPTPPAEPVTTTPCPVAITSSDPGTTTKTPVPAGVQDHFQSSEKTSWTRCGWPGSPNGEMIRPSFVPPVQIRRLRDLTRYRADLVNVCTAE
jgi:hypothetical protein